MLTYILMVRFVEALIKNDINNYLVDRYISGNVSVDFVRPVNLKTCAFASTMGESAFYFIFFTLPMLIFGGLIWGFQFPGQLWQYPFFAASVVLSFFIYGFLAYSMGISVFWFKIGGFVRMMMEGFIALFSGAVVPLWFYPVWLAKVAQYLPFRYMIYEPISIFMGRYTPVQALWVLCIQALWVGILYMFGRVLWRYASRVVTVQGG